MMYQLVNKRIETLAIAIYHTGAYLGGGHWAMASPLWVARIAKLHRKVSKIEAWPPPLQVGHQGLGSK